MGIVRLLDAGAVSMEQVHGWIFGADISTLTEVWDKLQEAGDRKRRR